ncbi:MAG: hypothetical protein LC749_05095 [Actinobacteria bacterium]|nr:hypothetical protein [Actinomycetota bacterium]
MVGYLEENFLPGEDHQLIIPTPTYVGEGGRTWDHTALVLERAAIEDARWPFAPGTIVKTAATPKMIGLGVGDRANAARNILAPALQIPDQSAIAGKDVLLFDDVFTSGSTLRQVALKLKAAGANHVDAVVLARQPWSG